MNEQGGGRDYDVERILPYKNSHILKLKGIESLAQADALAGREIFVPEGALPPLEDDRVYDFELIGCGVVTLAGDPVGTVTDLLSAGVSNLLVIDGGSGSEDILVPLNREICVEIDRTGRRIVIDPPDGLLDLNEI